MIIKTIKQLKKIMIAITGTTILVIGIAMIFLPGPSIIVIPVGLSVLATEFIWADKILKKFKSGLNYILNRRKSDGMKN